MVDLPFQFPSLYDPQLRWFSQAQCLPRPMPQLQSWLMDPGSLTHRLKAMSHENFNVRVIEEGWYQHCNPSLLQCFLPHVVRQRMWSRKVLLCCADTPWVAAHTLIPVSSMIGPLRQLRSLRDRPLGEVLFQDPQLQRLQLEITQYEDMWGRRSLFYSQDQPILVAEFFLPSLLEEDSKRMLSLNTGAY
ncbi:MAG: chorismate--pyruvate lyase family protein [Gammaproteobacteria bacterium]